MFALGIEFLTGTAVMTSADSRDTAEWPPHPARVFMALVAAHYETQPLPADPADIRSAWTEERKCLEWLEQQAAPELSCAEVPENHRRNVVKCYVPVNDTGLPGKPANIKPTEMRAALGVMPAFRSKQERTFPTVSLGIGEDRNRVHFIWREAELPTELAAAFHRLTAKVIRVGHSSSLTAVWLAESASLPASTLLPAVAPKVRRGGIKLRSIAPGFLADLDQRFNGEEINLFFDLNNQIQTSTGKAKTAAKEAFKSHFGEEWTRTLAAPVRRLPSVGVSQHYAPPGNEAAPVAKTLFDSELLVLTKHDGRILGLESTNLLMEALRGTLLTGSETAPSWFTGHRAPGEPADSPHLALFPLAYVGSEYADGHILGMAIAFPRAISPQERATQLRRLLFQPDGTDRQLTLTLGQQGEWTLQREDRSSLPTALKSKTWTEASTFWASVTPVVLDRHPKYDPSDPQEREAWRKEVMEIVTASCEHIGLPRPSSVDIDKTPWHRGSPRSRPGPGGIPWLSSKTNGHRQQIHVLLQFDCEVEGPVLIGAGRYRGYGLCKPLGLPPK